MIDFKRFFLFLIKCKKMGKKLFQLLFFACFGMTAEIFFVAFSNLISNTPFCNEPLYSLTGKTYVWMFPIYALIPFLLRFIYSKIAQYPILLRLFIYAFIIFCVEFLSGFLLKQITGKCPWEYTTGYHVCGFIQLEFTPFWMFFAFIIEYLYLFTEKIFEGRK